jgi:hypothetical protein
MILVVGANTSIAGEAVPCTDTAALLAARKLLLNEPAVVCGENNDNGGDGNGSLEGRYFAVFTPTVTGSFVVSVFLQTGDPSAQKRELYNSPFTTVIRSNTVLAEGTDVTGISILA